ncbi:MAG: hypothetical protein AAF383_27250 [Cyanobacteria bacterium P01_A01_bin.83]
MLSWKSSYSKFDEPNNSRWDSDRIQSKLLTPSLNMPQPLYDVCEKIHLILRNKAKIGSIN